MVQASAETLEHTGSAEKEGVDSVPQSVKLLRTPELLLQKEKEHSHLFRSPYCEVGESQGQRESHLSEKEEDRRGSMKRREPDPQRRRVPKRRGKTSKINFSRKSRRKHKRVSLCKSSSGRSAEFWFHSKSGQT